MSNPNKTPIREEDLMKSPGKSDPQTFKCHLY